MDKVKVTLELERHEAYELLSNSGDSEVGLEGQPELVEQIFAVAKFQVGDAVLYEETDRVIVEGITGFAGFPEYVGPGATLIYELSGEGDQGQVVYQEATEEQLSYPTDTGVTAPEED